MKVKLGRLRFVCIVISFITMTISARALSIDLTEVEPGVPKHIRVSSVLANEIVVPFDFDLIKFLSETSMASVRERNGSILVSTGDETVVQLILKDKATPSAPGYSLLLHAAQDIPGQHIVLSKGAANGEVFKSTAAPIVTSDYVDTIREYLRSAIQMMTPSGFVNDTSFEQSVISFSGSYGDRLSGVLVARATNSQYALEYYDIVNNGMETIELEESKLHISGVKGITFADGKKLLVPGEITRMAWLKDL